MLKTIYDENKNNDNNRNDLLAAAEYPVKKVYILKRYNLSKNKSKDSSKST